MLRRRLPDAPGVFQTTKAGGASNSNAFVAKLNPSGDALVYSTFIGGGDAVGNCTRAGPVAGNRVDKKGPTITINSPTANGNNLSSSAIALRAVGVGLVSTSVFGDVDSSGGANPDGDFRLVGGFYVFNMSTKGLGTGSYYLYFTAGSDPTLHAATFQLK